MFHDDDRMDEDEDFDALDELIRRFQAIKRGEAGYMMDEEAYEQVIEYYAQNSQEEEALLACDIARTYFPFSANVLLLKAEILTQAQKYGQALKVLDELDEYEQNNLDAVLLRSDIMLGQLKYDQAALYLEQQSQHFDGRDKAELLLELSDVYDECEEFEAVFETLRRVIAIDRRNEEALQKICFWAEFTGKLEESITLHEAIIEEDPYNALAWFNTGAAYQGLKMYEKAIDAYEYCIAIDEKFEFAYRNMADACMRMKWYDRALEVLQKHLEIAKPEDVIFEAMGICHERLKNFRQARHYYREAIRLSPKDGAIFFRIGECYSREGQWEKAMKSYSSALLLDKDNAAYYIAAGHCLMELDSTKDALAMYVNAVRLKPTSKTAWTTLIRGLYIAGYYQEALTQLAIARTHLPDKPDLYYYEAAALIELGKVKEGLLHLEHALQGAPARVKAFTELNPEYMRRASVMELIGRYKKK